MNLNSFIKILLLLFIYSPALSQTIPFIKGKIVDKSTHEPLESVVVMDERNVTTEVTDKYGNFAFSSANGDSLIVLLIGYKAQHVKIERGKLMLIELERGAITLKDVTISNINSLKTYNAITLMDLNMQPAKSAQDLLRLVPGLFIAQHQGGGKAEQIFLRGFDADHGTDVNVSVDGIPVNMVSHAHGQGYADMHFVIPETIAIYDFGKGPYYADKGDFTTAGYVAYSTKNALDQSMVKVEAGQYNTLRTVATIKLLGEKTKKKDQSAYIAAEGLYSDGGPFLYPEHFTRYNLFGKYHCKVSTNSRLTAELSTLSSAWRAAGEIPDRAVIEGYIPNRFGLIDSAQGGYTSRTNASIKLTTNLNSGWIVDNQLWYSHYYLNLISNFTFYLYFPTTGDEFRQIDNRDVYGYNGNLSRVSNIGNATFTSTFGGSFRFDNVYPNELDHTENGRFIEYLQCGDIQELNVNGYADETIKIGKWLFNGGIRLDYFHFNYQNLAYASTDSFATIFNGIIPSVQKAILSPKVSAEYTFNNKYQMYIKAGKGFHSNDARAVVANKGFEVLPAAYGTDLGANWKPFSKLYINMAAWYLYLQQEFTFGGDLIDQPGGPVGLSGRTVRMGFDFSARYQFTGWLFANLNINPARPRYIDSAKGHGYVALAPTFTSTAGLQFRLKNGINGGISYRYLHNRSANTDYSLTARGYFITDLTVNYTRKSYEIGMVIENLFNQPWDEAQFEYESRLKKEMTPVDEISYTPGVPFFARLKLSVFF